MCNKYLITLFSVLLWCNVMCAEFPIRGGIPLIEEVGVAMMGEEIDPVYAPFPVLPFVRPVFNDVIVDITNHGAVSGQVVTPIIQQCIDDLSRRGGGVVLLPRGEWNSGRIVLKNNVNLHIAEGASVYFSGELEDYQPAVFTRIEGIEVMSLGACIYANGQENIAITGKGILYGPADGPVREYIYSTTVIEKVVSLDKPVAQRQYSGMDGEGYFLPMFIAPIGCVNVLIEGVTLRNTAFWNIVPTYCKDVIIRGVTVNSIGVPRGDGIDIESSKHVLIEYCDLSSGDDCFTMKAGRGVDGIRVNRPTEDVIIRYCVAREGHGGITCGSETAGMIRRLYIHDCVFDQTGVGVRFKTRRPRGGGGESLYYERLRMDLRYTAFKWDMLGSVSSVGELANRLPKRDVDKLTPSFSHIKFRDIIVENSSCFLKMIGLPESPISDVTFENVEVNSVDLIKCSDVRGLKFVNTTVLAQDSVIVWRNCKAVSASQSGIKVTGYEVDLFKNIDEF